MDCKNGTTCVDQVSNYKCICYIGFTGHDCEIVQHTLNGPKETYLKVPVGSELTLNCTMSGLHTPTLYWTKVNGCWFKNKNIKESVYRQPHASIGDSGTYICAASDGSGPNNTRYFRVDITALQKEEVCDFDDRTLCGWEQQKNDNYDWTFQKGPTLSAGTGPDVDHTLGTVKGMYIYMEASAPRKFREYANILSPVLPANRTMCLEFWYYMLGDGSGRLFVFLQDTCTKMETRVFKEAGDKGAQWNKASVTIARHSVPNDYRIVLMADVGPTYRGDTAVDDLIINDGPCQGSHGAPIVG